MNQEKEDLEKMNEYLTAARQHQKMMSRRLRFAIYRSLAYPVAVGVFSLTALVFIAVYILSHLATAWENLSF